MARLLERFKLEVFQSSPLPTGSHRVFKASLEIDGSINVGGHSWRDGFPSYPLAAVRNLSEGRRLLDSAKPTGGWPYWHYLDEITGEWESLAHLWREPTGWAELSLDVASSRAPQKRLWSFPPNVTCETGPNQTFVSPGEYVQ